MSQETSLFCTTTQDSHSSAESGWPPYCLRRSSEKSVLFQILNHTLVRVLKTRGWLKLLLGDHLVEQDVPPRKLLYQVHWSFGQLLQGHKYDSNNASSLHFKFIRSHPPSPHIRADVSFHPRADIACAIKGSAVKNEKLSGRPWITWSGQIPYKANRAECISLYGSLPKTSTLPVRRSAETINFFKTSKAMNCILLVLLQ